VVASQSMDLRQLRCFHAVARHQHFTRASEELGLSQSSVSHHIRQLELSLGVELFVRTSRTVRLTRAGEALVPRAEQIVGQLDAATAEMQQFAGLVRGRIVLGTMRALGPIQLPALLRSFSERYPGIDVVMRENTTERTLEMLEAGDLDVAFIQLPEVLPSGVIAEVTHVEEFVLVVGAGHPLADRSEVSLTALAKDDFIVFTRGTGIDTTFRTACQSAGFEPHAKYESSALPTVRALAAAGLGVAMLPRSFAEDDEEARIVRIEQPTPIRRVALAWTDRPLPAGTAFVRYALDSDGGRLRQP
jgi:LysR family transcriptional regulator, transcription activator of glutamate synthase operon